MKERNLSEQEIERLMDSVMENNTYVMSPAAMELESVKKGKKKALSEKDAKKGFRREHEARRLLAKGEIEEFTPFTAGSEYQGELLDAYIRECIDDDEIDRRHRALADKTARTKWRELCGTASGLADFCSMYPGYAFLVADSAGAPPHNAEAVFADGCVLIRTAQGKTQMTDAVSKICGKHKGCAVQFDDASGTARSLADIQPDNIKKQLVFVLQ